MRAILISIFSLLISSYIYPISLKKLQDQTGEYDDTFILQTAIFGEMAILDLSCKDLEDIEGIENLKVKWSINGLEVALKNIKNLCLKLSNNRLKKLPSQITELHLMSVLDVSHNKLHTLPPFPSFLVSLNLEDNDLRVESFKRVKELKQLTWVYLANNILTEIPPVLYNSVHLKVLNISNNALAYIGHQIRQLAKLEELYVANDYLLCLPDEMMELKSLTKLVTNSKKIQLSHELEQFFNLRFIMLNAEIITEDKNNKTTIGESSDSWAVDSDEETVVCGW